MADFPDVLRGLYTGLPVLLNGTTISINGTPTPLAGIKAGTETKDSLDADAVNGFVRVTLIDDPDDGITRDATVDVEFFSTTYARGRAVSERIRGILRHEAKIGGVIIDRRITKSGPKEADWDENQNVRRFIATYVLSTRR